MCYVNDSSSGSRISRRGRQPRRGRQLPRQLCFEKFVCQNERIWTRGGGGRRRRPWIHHWTQTGQDNLMDKVLTRVQFLLVFRLNWKTLLGDEPKPQLGKVEIWLNFSSFEMHAFQLKCEFKCKWNTQQSWFPLKSVSILGIGDRRLSRKA